MFNYDTVNFIFTEISGEFYKNARNPVFTKVAETIQDIRSDRV